MMIVNLLIWALLGAWMLQVTLAVGTAIYLIARATMTRDRAAPRVAGIGIV